MRTNVTEMNHSRLKIVPLALSSLDSLTNMKVSESSWVYYSVSNVWELFSQIKLTVLSTNNMRTWLYFVFTRWITFRPGDPETDLWHLDHDVSYTDVIIVCFHDTLYQLKYFELQCTFQCNFADTRLKFS